MNALNRASAAALIVLAPVACQPTTQTGRTEPQPGPPLAASTPSGVAVVELFTSEGCSSCPPADALLGELAAARAAEGRVFALSFHVDYWDELGWRDGSASPAATARQQAYAESLGSRGLYTPQMIVNGAAAFTGSDRSRAEEHIARALSRPVEVPLSLAVTAAAGHRLRVDFDAPRAPADAVIDVAVVEHSTSTDVRAGENAGRRLTHTNVVRAFAVVAAAAHGSTLIAMPPTLRSSDGELIAYVQRVSDPAGGMPVLGATRAPLPK